MLSFHPKRWYAQYQIVGPRMFWRRRVMVLANLAQRQLPAGPLGPAHSDITLDVLLPVAEKDLPVVPHTLAALRANLRHPLGEVVLVAPDAPAVRRLAAAEGCRFVPEQEVLPLRPADIGYIVHGRDRSGWIMQQLIKLSADRVCAQPYILVLDADTLLLQPHCFVRGAQTALLYSDEFHPAYYQTYQKLLGEPTRWPASFNSHYMLLRAERLQALRATLEARHGLAWHAAIVAHLDHSVRSSFADYETYGNFVLSRAPGSVWLEYWHNRAVSRAQSGDVPQLARRLSARYRSLSLHSYLV